MREAHLAVAAAASFLRSRSPKREFQTDTCTSSTHTVPCMESSSQIPESSQHSMRAGPWQTTSPKNLEHRHPREPIPRQAPKRRIGQSGTTASRWRVFRHLLQTKRNRVSRKGAPDRRPWKNVELCVAEARAKVASKLA